MERQKTTFPVTMQRAAGVRNGDLMQISISVG
jgi:hypothetical protein